MIFSSLFRPKHQDPNPQVRINAIEKLSTTEPEQKSVLHELAFNDPDANVSLAALNKLDSFVLWYKMAQTAKNARVAKKSQQVIEQVLLSEQNNKIDQREKRTFIEECTDNKIMEKLVMQPWLQNDLELAVLLLDKLAKPQLSRQVLFSTKNVDLQLKLLKSIDDESGLNKVLKKVTIAKVKQAAQQQLDDLLASKQLPLEVDKETRLILARLLALKDSDDLPYIELHRSDLLEHYHNLAAKFVCLPHSSKQNFDEKFSDIARKLDTLVTTLKPLWERKLAAIKLQELVQDVSQQAEVLLAKISAQLHENITDITSQQRNELEQQLDSNLQQVHSLISELANDAENPRRQLEKLNNQLLSCQNTLHSLPEFQIAIEQANILIDKFAGLTLANDISQLDLAQQHLNDAQHQWKKLTQPYAENWPHGIKQRWMGQQKKWQQAIKGLKDKLQSDVNRCRNKMRTVDSMVNQGKFKLAMGLYEKIVPWYQALPEKQKEQLERQFSKVKEQIEDLKDWQDYIAAPRKPILLAEAEALVVKPLVIEQQANKIKELRQQWNSLGKLESESDQALNKAFEGTIEQAFAPCRDYYNQQELQREANMAAKQRLIENLKTLSEKTLPDADLVKQVRVLQQQWQTIGEVDYKQREALNQQYHAQVGPLKARVNQYYQDNAEQKQQLLNKTQQLLALEDVSEAIEQAKKLQDKWKTIEHAGRKAEAQLWPAFRTANDQIFAKLKVQQEHEKQAVDSQIEQANSLLIGMQEQISKAQDKASLTASLESQSELSNLLNSLPPRARNSLDNLLNQNLQAQQTKFVEIEQNRQQQQFHDLFAALKEWKNETSLPSLLQSLPAVWQRCFKNVANGPDMDRHTLTIVMEIIGERESPKVDSAKRKEIQLQLMAEKLQKGTNKSLEEWLKDWIQVGPIGENEGSLLKRIEKLFR
ncbi:MAG: exonuclease SbcC [Paraglaciecola sp.]|jgi:exonuclease SbcC